MDATADTSSAADMARRAERDEHFLEYMNAYEEYTRLSLELEAQLRKGHIALSKARRDLSSKRITLGPTLYPSEFSALLKVRADEETQSGDRSSQLRVHHVTDEEAAAAEAEAAAKRSAGKEDGGDAKPSARDAESAALAELQNWGVDGELQREIASAVTDFGDEVAMACGDVLAIERQDGRAGGDAHSVRSTMAFSTSAGLDDLKRSQFRAALAASDGPDGEGKQRPAPQTRPSSHRDPLRWFTLLPPPALRQAQQGFRGAAETTVLCANAQARMEAARTRYEALAM